MDCSTSDTASRLSALTLMLEYSNFVSVFPVRSLRSDLSALMSIITPPLVS